MFVIMMTNFVQISSSFEETDVLLEADTHPSPRDQTIGQPSGRPPNSWRQNRYSKPHCLFVRYHIDESLYIRYKSMQLSLIININAMCCQMIVNTNNIIGTYISQVWQWLRQKGKRYKWSKEMLKGSKRMALLYSYFFFLVRRLFLQ